MKKNIEKKTFSSWCDKVKNWMKSFRTFVLDVMITAVVGGNRNNRKGEQYAKKVTITNLIRKWKEWKVMLVMLVEGWWEVVTSDKGEQDTHITYTPSPLNLSLMKYMKIGTPLTNSTVSKASTNTLSSMAKSCSSLINPSFLSIMIITSSLTISWISMATKNSLFQNQKSNNS